MNPWIDFLFQIFVGYSPNKRAAKKEKKQGSQLLTIQSTSTPQTLLHQAVLKNDLEGVRDLLRNKHLIDPIGPRGNTPLMIAVEKKHLFIVRALLGAGANPHLKNMNNETPYSLAQKSTHLGIQQAFGIDPSTQNEIKA